MENTIKEKPAKTIFKTVPLRYTPRVSLFITFPYSTTISTNLLNFFGRLILI